MSSIAHSTYSFCSASSVPFETKRGRECVKKLIGRTSKWASHYRVCSRQDTVLLSTSSDRNDYGHIVLSKKHKSSESNCILNH